jgi:hypothetical protein
MTGSRKRPSRRSFLKTAAGVATSTALIRTSLWAQSKSVDATATDDRSLAFPRINQQFMITPDRAWDWASFKSEGGPTYAGSAGWKRYTDFLISKMPEFGAVDLDYVEIPYDHYIVDDWPDRRTHIHDSGIALEKLVSDGTPVPVVASYGMTSGFTPQGGLTAPMLYYDRAHPPADAQIAGKILVFQTAQYPDPPYTNSFLDNYTPTDYEWRSPGKWAPLFTPPPASVTSSYHSRWVWSQVNACAAIGIRGHAAGMVMVYDLSPGAAFGLVQRSVYTPNGKAGLGAVYVNCPTLALDRVNGARVLADAKVGRTATLTLSARFQRDTGKAIVGYLPGRDYGTPRDEQLLLATHTDAMSLIEENGGLGVLGIVSYFNHVPRSARPRTLVFYLDCRHFMPGGEGGWPQFDYIWWIETIAKAATDNKWPRVDVKAGNVEPGVNGGFQGTVKSPMNKGRTYGIPGIGLAGDWPGGWTQTSAQLDTEAGLHGFDEQLFVKQVAGLSQLAGELMLVRPIVIDLGWGNLKSALIDLPDSAFIAPQNAATQRQTLTHQYVAVFRDVEVAAYGDARSTLKELAGNVSAWVVSGKRAALSTLVDGQISKLS